MKRRHFIKVTSLSTFVLPSVFLSACEKRTSGTTVAEIRDPENDVFELEEFTADALQDGMTSGKYTSRSITQLYLDRIQKIDKNEDGIFLNSVIEINPEALSIAEALDAERKEGKIRGPLHGIPVLIKDNINTGDQMMTTAGSLALEGNRAKQDSFIIQQLRASGAVLLGKTNLSEWANFRSTRSSSGWSSRGGQTKNPFVLDRNPCGSSSGSGAAVSANLCAIAIGTETNGSIACPSSINGIVGIKPTVGLWSRSGIIPISQTQDTAGPMARTVRDAALLLGALTGIDDNDPVTQKSEGKSYRDYTQFLNPDGLKGKRIGVEKSFLKVHEVVDTLLQEALEAMKQKGAEIIEVDFLSRAKGISSDEYAVLQFEFKDGVNKYLAATSGGAKSLQEVIEFNRKNEARAMPFFKQEILETSQEKGDLNSKEYKEALKKILTVTREAIDGMLKEFKLDAISGPTNGPTWCTDLVNGDFFTGYGMYSSAAIAGYPHINVPMGLAQGLPVGLTFIGPAFGEPGLLAIAYAYEQASQKRISPTFARDFSKLK
jgi:amidase